MIHARLTPLALATALLALAGCNKTEPGAQNTAAPAASAASAAASSAALPASGPLIAPVAASAPTDAQRSAGQQIAQQGGGGAVSACVTCHGQQGEGNAAAGFPRIAGQAHAYLLHQLQSYASGLRNNEVMGPIAKAMSEQQRTDAAAYYASLAPAGAASAAAPAAPASGNVQRGHQLAAMGDESKAVQGCANCHGPGGIGEGTRYPYLAGQHASYLVKALAEWRDGSRHNDATEQMPIIAKALGEADAQAVAAWFAQQPPPDMARDAAPVQPPASAASAVVSGPREAASSSTGMQGVGSEQGAPTTGGSQGIGGGGAATGAGAQGGSGGTPVMPGSGASAAGSSPRR